MFYEQNDYEKLSQHSSSNHSVLNEFSSSKLSLACSHEIPEHSVQLLNHRSIIISENQRLLIQSSFQASIFNLLLSTFGTGIVSIPYAMKELGVLLGILSLLFMGVCSIEATKLLTIAMDITGAVAYEQLALKAGNNYLAKFAAIMMFFFNFGAAVGYQICCGNIFIVLIESFDLTQYLPSPDTSFKIILLLITVFVELPLCMADTLQSLSFVSIFGFLALESLVIQIFLKALFGFPANIHNDSHGSILWPKSFEAIFNAFPLLVFSFSCQSNSTTIYRELERASYRRMSKIALWATAITMINYFLIGISGIFIYGNLVKINILSNFHKQLKEDSFFLIAFLGTLFGVLVAFPMNIFPCKRALSSHFYTNHYNESTKEKLVFASLLVFSAFFIAIWIPSLKTVLSLVGATSGSCITFIFPGIFIILINSHHPIEKKLLQKSYVLVFIGTIILIIGSVISVMQIFR